MTGFFAQKSVAGFDGITTIDGGWLDHNWKQLGYQAANSAAGMGYSFIATVRNLISNIADVAKMADTASDHYFMGHALHSFLLPPLQ
jgi:ammonia channel protein AmtB